VSALAFAPWHFLTAPLDDLLQQCGVLGVIPDPGNGGFLAGIKPLDSGALFVYVAPCASAIERDTVLRGILARWFGVDTADWPVEMEFSGEAAR